MNSVLVVTIEMFCKVEYHSPDSKILDDRGPILFAHTVQAWANVGHALGNALGDDNIGPDIGSDRVHKQYWAKFGATRGSILRTTITPSRISKLLIM